MTNPSPAYFAAVTAASYLAGDEEEEIATVVQNNGGSATFKWEYVDGRVYHVTVKQAVEDITP